MNASGYVLDAETLTDLGLEVLNRAPTVPLGLITKERAVHTLEAPRTLSMCPMPKQYPGSPNVWLNKRPMQLFHVCTHPRTLSLAPSCS